MRLQHPLRNTDRLNKRGTISGQATSGVLGQAGRNALAVSVAGGGLFPHSRRKQWMGGREGQHYRQQNDKRPDCPEPPHEMTIGCSARPEVASEVVDEFLAGND